MNKIKIEVGYGARLGKNGARLQDVDLRQWKAEQEVMRVFGAFTRVNSFGGWKNPDNGIHFYEDGCTLFVTVDDTPINRGSAAHVAAYVKGCFEQEAVCLTITPCTFQLI